MHYFRSANSSSVFMSVMA